MSNWIGRAGFARMVTCAAAEIRSHQNLLSELDSIAGDGDHGNTMVRAFDAIEAAFRSEQHRDLKSSLCKSGWDLLGVNGGASGALLGSFFLGMGESLCADLSLNVQQIAAMFDAGLKAVQMQTNARPGDKTLMDALVPAVGALLSITSEVTDVSEAFRMAASAARTGSESTKGFSARFGRSKFLGEKTLGYPDAGATSVWLMFEGFHLGVIEKGEGEDGGLG